ncbi:PilZ domain-containing protein [Thermodesulfobacteriota bacterium]
MQWSKRMEHKLTIGLGSELIIQIEGMEERFRAVMTGMEPSEYLIVRMQLTSKLFKQIAKGSVLIVRYSYMGNVYMFRAKSLGSIRTPVKLFFLSYPEKIETCNIRKAERINCYIPAAALLNDNEIRGVVTDLSTGGTRFTINNKTIELQREVSIEDSVSLSFPLLGIDGIQRSQGRIKRLDGDIEKISFGIQFEDIDPRIVDRIDVYVRDVLEYR